MALREPLIVRVGHFYLLHYGRIPWQRRIGLAIAVLLGRTQRVHQPIAGEDPS